MWDQVVSAFGAVAIYWAKAKDLVREFPGTVLVLWAASFVAGVWL